MFMSSGFLVAVKKWQLFASNISLTRRKRSLNSLPHNDNFLVAFLCHDNESATPVGAQISRFCLKVPINHFFSVQGGHVFERLEVTESPQHSNQKLKSSVSHDRPKAALKTMDWIVLSLKNRWTT